MNLLNKIANILFEQVGRFFLKATNKTDSDKRVLLVKDDAFGDFLLFTGALKFYQTRLRKENVFLLVIDRIADVAQLYIESENLLVFSPNKFEKEIIYKIKFLNSIRSIGFETVIASTHRSSNCNKLVKLIAAKNNYGYEKEQIFSSRRINYYNHQIKSFDKVTPSSDPHVYNHVLEHEAYFLSQVLNISGFLSDEILPFIPTKGFQKKIEDSYFVLLPEAGDMIRAYPVEELAEVMKTLCKQYGMKCVVLGTGKGYDASVFESENSILLLGKTTLIEALEYIQFSQFTLGNETGLSHASWIMHNPTVMIYGGGHYGRFLPLNDFCTLVTHKMDCYCCHWACKFDSPIVPCVSNIKKGEILKAVEELGFEPNT
jgi:ADP-heptose:LPS heptosyltransferase